MMKGLAVNPAPLITMTHGIRGILSSFPAGCGGKVCLSRTVFGMDPDTVVVASVMCEAKNVDLQISELPGLYGDIGSGPGTPFPEPGAMLQVLDVWSFVDAGPKGPSPVSGDASDPPVSISMVDSGLAPPEPELGDMLRLPDFSSDIDPLGEPFPGSGCILAWPAFMSALESGHGRLSPESEGILDQPSFVDNLDTGSGKSFSQYGGTLWVRSYRSRELGCMYLITLVVWIRGPGVPWPESACQSDMSDIVCAFDPGPEWPFQGPGDIMRFPDVLGAGSGKPSTGSGDMLVLPNFVGDFDPGPRRILPEFGDMYPGSVACPCLHTETSAGSGPDSYDLGGGGYTPFGRLGDSMSFYLKTVGPLCCLG